MRTTQVYTSCSFESKATNRSCSKNMINNCWKSNNVRKKVSLFQNFLKWTKRSRLKKTLQTTNWILTSMRKRITIRQKITAGSYAGMRCCWRHQMLLWLILSIIGSITAAQCGCRGQLLLLRPRWRWTSWTFPSLHMDASFAVKRAAM